MQQGCHFQSVDEFVLGVTGKTIGGYQFWPAKMYLIKI
jgi:hypothetical protein